MSTLSPEQQAQLARFLAQPDRLADALAGLSEAQLDWSPGPGEWSIRQIIHHLTDDADWGSANLKLAIGACGHPAAPIRADVYPGNDAMAERLDYAGRSIAPALALIRASRAYVAELYAHCAHALDGEVVFINAAGDVLFRASAAQMLPMVVEHMDEHLATIVAIRQRLG